jgi:hypothetical protein
VGNRPLSRFIRMCETNIKICLKETVRKGVDSNHLVENNDKWRAYMNTVVGFRGLRSRGISLSSRLV